MNLLLAFRGGRGEAQVFMFYVCSEEDLQL